MMIRGLGDTSTVKQQIVSAANQYGVDPNLALAVAQQESSFQQYNKSGGILQSTLSNGQPGALGVMQLMPATAASLGVDPTNQQQNIQGGVKLLSQLLQQFGGNVPNALAAYNAGPNAVIKAGGVPQIAETQNYVSSIMTNYQSMGGGGSTAAAPTPAGDSGSSADDSTTSDTPSPDPFASATGFLSGIDFTDPGTIATAGLIGATLLYLVFD